jgi:hypothetical protein
MECRTLWAGASATAILRLYPDEVETKNGSQMGLDPPACLHMYEAAAAIDSLRTRRFKHGRFRLSSNR